VALKASSPHSRGSVAAVVVSGAFVVTGVVVCGFVVTGVVSGALVVVAAVGSGGGEMGLRRPERPPRRAVRL